MRFALDARIFVDGTLPEVVNESSGYSITFQQVVNSELKAFGQEATGEGSQD